MFYVFLDPEAAAGHAQELRRVGCSAQKCQSKLGQRVSVLFSFFRFDSPTVIQFVVCCDKLLATIVISSQSYRRAAACCLSERFVSVDMVFGVSAWPP